MSEEEINTTCTECQGHGMILFYGDLMKCPQCEGSGKHVAYSIPMGYTPPLRIYDDGNNIYLRDRYSTPAHRDNSHDRKNRK